MRKSFILLSFLMGIVVLSSNYLVQFPINYYGLDQLLTYGAFSYPIAFLITDLANRSFGKFVAQKIVYFGFILGIGFTVIFSTDFADLKCFNKEIDRNALGYIKYIFIRLIIFSNQFFFDISM